MIIGTKLAANEPYYLIPTLAVDWRFGFGIAFKWFRIGFAVWFPNEEGWRLIDESNE